MANPEHIEILKQGVDAWNSWRNLNPKQRPDLSNANLIKMHLPNVDFRGADLGDAKLSHADLTGARLRSARLCGAELYYAKLSGAKLPGADLSGARLNGAQITRADLLGVNLEHAFIQRANLQEANLFGANLMFSDMSHSDLTEADLTEAKLNGAKVCYADLTEARLEEGDLSKADFSEVTLYKANLTQATLVHTNCFRADLTKANLRRANLQEVNLTYARLIETDLDAAKLRGCYVYGISAWNLQGKPDSQSYVTITPYYEPSCTVDDLEVAQFIYLLLNNQKVHHLVDTVTSKVVLILGRFTDKRKTVLDAIREELRRGNFTPVIFDFDKPASKDLTGTVELLARMARFIVADLTDPSSIPHELATIVPFLRTTPVLPLQLAGSGGYSMFRDLQSAYRWVLQTHEYQDCQSLISDLPKVIAPADEMAEQLRRQGAA